MNSALLNLFARTYKPLVSSQPPVSDQNKVAVIDLKRFSVLIQQTPYFAVEVMGVMAERLRRSTGPD